jgi:uncharacterized membrane protein YphA (DoxX/SURF4 family)
MRLVIGSVLVVQASPGLWSHQPLHSTLASASLVLLGLLLIAGLWSPMAAVAVAVIEISQILTSGQDPRVSLLEGTIAAALAMLGPGRWSVDSRLFGWKRIEAPPRNNALVRSDGAPPTPPHS